LQGEFVLTHPDIKIPERGNIYSFNEANKPDWDETLQNYISDIQQGDGETEVSYTSRYVGSMCADIHRTLLYGGIFGYPADSSNPNGKLRLLYEAAPMAFLLEQAGGAATTGTKRIMDIIPDQVHQRVPCILGSPEDVAECVSYIEDDIHEVTPEQEKEGNALRQLLEFMISP
jgi:fructose-1,6-bisphosphatase I